ncbi:MAG: hypothetical protein PHC28_06300 [Flavobacterium sp.]|uniref:hypothetical protein n=1 Tax=Flavobacterium sp. TaxID=239 RepID=UPI0026321C02|nr:hypothetical protein [Flavobacterium sp.]MDD5150081.1 hypothetical protein [Flavobacterium sp.]
MKRILQFSAVALFFGFLFSCTPVENRVSTDMTYTQAKLDYTATLTGNTLTMTNNNSDIIPYWTVSNSSGVVVATFNTNIATLYLYFAGDYTVNYTAYTKGGSIEATPIVVTITTPDLSQFTDPRWALLTNGADGKTWILKKADPVEYAGINYPHSAVMDAIYGIPTTRDWNWDPGSLQSWSGYEDKDWGEITFNMNGGLNVITTQTSFTTGSTTKKSTSAAFNYTMTSDFSNDKLLFTGGAEMLHMNESSPLNFSNVRLIELTDTTLCYTAVTTGTGITIYHLIAK